MSATVEDLLTLARSDAREFPLSIQPTDLHALASQAVQRLSPFAQRRGVTARAEGPAPRPRSSATPSISVTLCAT